MNEINGIPDSLLQEMQVPGQESKSISSEFGKDAFMTLMLTQLKNQNPMEPMTNGEFLTQIAQFTSANGISEMQNSFAEFAGTMQSQQVLQAANMIGRQVVVAADKVNWNGTDFAVARIALPAVSENLSVAITNSQGVPIRSFNLGPQASGMVPFAWDGLDDTGNAVSPGVYVIKAQSIDQGESTALETMVSASVESIVLGRNGGQTVLNLQNLGPVPMSQIQEIM